MSGTVEGWWYVKNVPNSCSVEVWCNQIRSPKGTPDKYIATFANQREANAVVLAQRDGELTYER